MHKSKSHSFVIFPSTIRPIPFIVPALASSCSCPCSCSQTAATRDPRYLVDGPKRCSCRGHCLKTSSVDSSSSPTTTPDASADPQNLPDGDSSASGRRRPSETEKRTSQPYFTRDADLDRRTRDSDSISSCSNSLKKWNDYRNSCNNIANKTTVDLDHANLLLGIDPSLYLSSESGLDGGSSNGGWPDEDDDGDDVDDDEDDDSGNYDELNIGRVWFSLQYDPESERLIVRLMRIRNLPSSFAANYSARDPIVRMWLMPDERRWVQAKFKKKTRNPRFNENFAFQVSIRDFAERSIKFTVFGFGDRQNRRQMAFGHVVYRLRDHVYEPNERVIVWRDLEKEPSTSQPKTEESQLHLSLNYSSDSGRLCVAIHSGKNFPPSDNHVRVSNGFYVVVNHMEMSKVIKKKKTSIVKQSVNFCPIFNELFHFKVRSPSLDLTSLLVTAMRQTPGQKDMSIGRLVLGSFMFARGPELDHWNAMLANENDQITKWHTLTN